MPPLVVETATDNSSGDIAFCSDALGLANKKQVTFADNLVSERHCLPPLKLNEKCLLWFSKKEMAAIRQGCVCLVRKASTESQSVSIGARKSTNPEELRGLECKMPLVLMRRRQLRDNAMKLVLKEQEFQRRRNFVDPNHISLLYGQFSSRPVLEARLMGRKDEYAVKTENQDASNSATSRRMEI